MFINIIKNKKKKLLLNKKGHTLMEMLVVISVLGFIIPVVYTFMGQSLNLFNSEVKGSQERSEIQYIITELKEEIRNAQVVERYEEGILIDGEYFGMFGGMYKSHGVIMSGVKDVEFTDVNDRFVTFVVKGGKQHVTQVVGLFKTSYKFTSDNEDAEGISDVGVYTNRVSITGSSRLVGSGKTVIINNGLLNGSANVNYLEVDNIYVGGSVNLPNSMLGNGNGTIYITGDLTLSGSGASQPRIYGNLELGGKIINNIYGSDLNVLITGERKENTEVLLPQVNMPQLNTDEWYDDNGFSNIPGSLWYRGGSISFGSIYENQEYLIVSDGDVRLNYWQHMSGIIFAPNGKVEIGGSAQFTGVIIADTIEISGNAKVNLVDMHITLVGIE